jgi:NAD(P)-dependent dehydrogenase (short-subunit alcohol dehydrogenase family)
MPTRRKVMKRLENKVALITGGGGGIGGAIAEAYAQEGCAVCLTDINGKNMDTVLRKVKKHKMKSRKFVLDVTESKAVDQMVKDIVADWGAIDILVNTAGTFPMHAITEIDDESWDRTIKTHLYGSFYCIRAVLRESMLPRNTGRIINIASLAPYVGGPWVVEYTAAKGGIIGLNMAVAKELGRTGINCNAIAPGYINTPMTAHLYREGAIKEALEMWKIAKGRIGKPEDMVGAAIFLASDESAYITAQVIFVDGGSVG